MLSSRLPVFNESINVSDKRVIVRVDFNVPAEDARITDEYRILRTLPLLEQLRGNGARLVLLSHLTEKKEHRSFRSLMEEFQRVCGFSIEFAPTLLAARQSKAPTVLLENLRVFSGEEERDPQFAKELALLGDLFINEAFSQSHRPNASIVELPTLLPSYAGSLFYEEVRKLEEVSSPEKPFLLILGGVKFATKIGVLEHFVEVADTIFIGGVLANTFLAASGFSVGESPVEKDALPRVRDVFIGKPNIMLPADVRVEGNEVRAVPEIRAQDVIY
ncbi:MAG: phosphoglycerate kinase, partial [Patescibacteria group bacterium]